VLLFCTPQGETYIISCHIKGENYSLWIHSEEKKSMAHIFSLLPYYAYESVIWNITMRLKFKVEV